MAIENPQKTGYKHFFIFKNIYVAFWLKKAACKLLGARPRRRGRKNKVLYNAESPSSTHNQSVCDSAQTDSSLSCLTPGVASTSEGGLFRGYNFKTWELF